MTALTALAQDFDRLAVCRTLFGLFEGGTYPAILLTFNTMYRRSEQSAALGFVFLSNAVSSVVGTAAFVGIAKMGSSHVDCPNYWLLRITQEEETIMQERTKDNAVVRISTIE
ncbi:uncharacterized protein ATC70_005098 [Mucor velutinosus]|uniref:Uncharacterized protein n=1 Tax=Mucor velutinosus TaxID=708070 RepID=A0AAN7HX35_9FUNG|nr:hypothetical protein ATC70_005098 [Mucor velutinosus]